ncbi:alpha/beta hydrolase [Amaricoccus sp.]|uniref:alpha/beta fold hydrolase n=1 Tax=Amaricoccus sp. TaxID=1872485 RepID=UPI001B75FF7E|nr:alpha/beta hydrolase [Amaricoccus sp.]MBP7243149.1 alpha/beta hydrolase [Amaricoccus sp.]
MTRYPVATSDHHVALDGRRLFARRWQAADADRNGPALVLLHDSLGCVELWRDFPERLAEATGLPVVAYDRLGFGRSDPNPARLDRDFMADEARTGFTAVREQLGVDRFIPFGHSAGGGMAVAVATAFPGACAAVITQAAQAFAEDRTLAGIRDAMVQFADPDQMARLARYHGDKAQWVFDAWTETWLAPDFADWTLDALLEEVRCPILAIHGDRDEYGSRAHPERIAAGAGGPVTPLLLENCGHLPHREYPAPVIAAVQSLLATVTAPVPR